nr:hypothetical protein [Bradyrhizobium lablabi]
MENVRRYRTIASLCRQAAAFRPTQRHSLLAQAEQWEHLAVVELEGYFGASENVSFDFPIQALQRRETQWNAMAAIL